MYKNTYAFTLVELVVAATILVILTSIGFYNYTKNISDARDGARHTDLSALASQLSLYKKQRWAYPHPAKSFHITNKGRVVVQQWYMSQNVALSTAQSIPLDPELHIPYIYSVSSNRQEYQLAGSLENSESPIALVLWDYKTVAKNILPTLVLATESEADVEISSGNPARNLFIFDKGFHTLPYDFDVWIPYSDGTSFSGILDDAWADFFQNSDYRSCEEISTAAKRITPDGESDEYQIRDADGWLINQMCSCSSTGCSNI